MSLGQYILQLIDEFAPTVRQTFVRRWDVFKSRASDFATSARQLWRRILLGIIHIREWNESLTITSKLILGLVFFLTLFFFWQLMAYELEQTLFVTVNLLMVTAISVATCWILLYTQREITDKDQDIEELDKKIERNKQNLKKVKAELFQLRDKQRKETSAENIVEKLSDNIKSAKAKRDTSDGSWQWLLDAFVRSFDLSGGTIYSRPDGQSDYHLDASYALSEDPHVETISSEVGYIGQVTESKRPLVLRNVPSDYLMAISGLGRSKNLNVYIFPIIKEDVVRGVVEIATFGKLPIMAGWDGINNLLQKEA